MTREDNVHVGIYHLGETLDTSLCAGGGTSESLFDLEPGLHHFVVEVDPEGVASQSDTSVLFALVPENRR